MGFSHGIYLSLLYRLTYICAIVMTLYSNELYYLFTVNVFAVFLSAVTVRVVRVCNFN